MEKPLNVESPSSISPSVLVALEFVKQNRSWYKEVINGMKNYFIRVSFNNDDIDVLEHLKGLLLIEDLINELSNYDDG